MWQRSIKSLLKHSLCICRPAPSGTFLAQHYVATKQIVAESQTRHLPSHLRRRLLFSYLYTYRYVVIMLEIKCPISVMELFEGRPRKEVLKQPQVLGINCSIEEKFPKTPHEGFNWSN